MERSLDANTAWLNEALGVPNNYDVILRRIEVAGKKACTYSIDGFSDGAVQQRIVQYLIGLKVGELPADPQTMFTKCIPFNESILTDDKQKILLLVFSGMTCLLIDGYDKAVLIDCREYPARPVMEPEKDKVMRGSKDGFVETIVFNTALIRRRIRSSELALQLFHVGTSSQTDIVLCYMKGRADEKFLQTIIQRIEAIKTDSLTMNMESFAECIYHGCWWNPLPKFKYTERPDTAAASLLEGNLVILVDNSPTVMILPNTIFDAIEDTDDYYFPPITGTYLRLSRLAVTVLAIFLTPIFLLLIRHPDWLPEWLRFIQLQDVEHVPVFLQFILLEFAIDGLRLATLNTPNMLSTPLSVIAGIVVGEFAVSSGWFNSEIVLYMAFVSLANYSQSSLELSYAIKFIRISLLALTALFGLWGLLLGTIGVVLLVFTNKNVAGGSYLYPRTPIRGKSLLYRFFRISLRTKDRQ